MKINFLVATFGVLLAVPVLALAQQALHAPDPADPQIAVPPPTYESAFAGTAMPKPEQGDVTPDKVWRSANDTVAGISGHAGHGAASAPAGVQAHAGHAAPAPAAKPAAQPTADHSKHH